MNSEKATDQKGLNVLDLLTVASLQKPEHQFRKALPSIKDLQKELQKRASTAASSTKKTQKLSRLGVSGNAVLTDSEEFYFCISPHGNVRTLKAPSPDPEKATQGIRARHKSMAVAARSKSHGPLPMLPRIYHGPQEPEPALLDGFLLLKASGMHMPEDVVTVDLTARNINAIESADMEHFVNLRSVDFSCNKIPDLGCLTAISSLQRLLLAGNNMTALGTWLPTSFVNLQALDLSFNCLDSASIVSLGSLPCLNYLDVSGNDLKELPSSLAGFENLQSFVGAQNGFHSSVLVALGALPSLKDVQLGYNAIDGIPEDLEGKNCFPELQAVDLTGNMISDAKNLDRLRRVNHRVTVLLAANPLASRRRATVMGSAGSDCQDAADAHGLPKQDLILFFEPPDASVPSLSRVYDESDPLAVVPEFPHSSLQPGPILFDQANHDRIVVAFDRLQADMAAWTESAREAGELPGPSYSSGDAQAGPSIGAEKTLLGRIEEGMQFSEGGGPEAAPAGNTGGSGNPEGADLAVEEYSDPTLRLAVALGLDPARLAVFNGHMGTNSTKAVNALHFALAHPLSRNDENDEMDTPLDPHFLKTTVSTVAKRRPRAAPAVPAQANAPLDLRSRKMETISGILSGMKSRLAAVEAALGSQLPQEKNPAALSVPSEAAADASLSPTSV